MITQPAKHWAVLLQEVMQVFDDIRLAYGESDEYSFVFSKTSILYGRPHSGWQGVRPSTHVSASLCPAWRLQRLIVYRLITTLPSLRRMLQILPVKLSLWRKSV